MYSNSRKRTRNDNNEVRGPNSALTQFLREQGISAEAIKQKWESSRQVKEDEKSESEASEEDSEGDSAGHSLEEGSSGSANGFATEVDDGFQRRALLRSRLQEDSDDEEYGEEPPTGSSIAQSQKDDSSRDANLLQVKRKLLLQQRKRKKKQAVDLLDKKTKRVTSLQDFCVAAISENIKKYNQENKIMDKHVRDVLGGVSLKNMNKLADALSKGRALDDHTLQLFLKTELSEVTFHDCSKITSDGYKQLAVFTPHLTKLSLQMCGQLNNEGLLFIADKLTNLKELYLDGPFLINEETWCLFWKRQKGLEAFHIANTHRFTDACLLSMLEHCGQSLKSLKLSRMDSIKNYAVLPQYLCNPQFHTLILQYPANEEDVSDEIIIKILSICGLHIRSLNLDGCTGLTDDTLINGFTPFLKMRNSMSALEELSVEELDQITGDSLLHFISSVQLTRLRYLSVRRCWQLDDIAVAGLWRNDCSKSLVNLNLNSLKKLTANCFERMFCPSLRQLNVGFVRCVNNQIVKFLSEQNPNLELLEVYGDNLVTEDAEFRSNMILIGRQ